MGNLKNLMYGLYYSYQQRVVFLPLLEVRAEASVKELAAQVKLTQTYGNDASFLVGAKYSFPIPARAAVCSFAMIKQDGTRVVGSVQEKLEARKTYDTAVSQGQQASLVEQQTPDVFQVSVGNIPANEQVQIELVYATELSEDEENDAVRFHLPIHIGARYGKAPDGLRSAALSSAPFLTITTSVETLAPISKISSPSHIVSTEFGPDPALPNFKDLPFSKYARVSLSSNSALDKDFVLTIKSTDLDAPRCVAELHPTHDTAALALTFVPRFALPDLARQEFILLVDRSGSMSGARIAAARKALVILLRALPHKDTLFQLASFGNHATSLWPQGSRAYNQTTLEEATAHVDGMSADCGGTEIRGALDHVFWCRARDRPTSVLLLTDGDAWDLKGVLDTVKKAVEGAPDKAPLRVSVLGIGNSASTAMCEGIARVGNGTCMLVGEQEVSFAGKVARLLKAARTPVIQDINVDWGRGFVPTAAEPEEEDFEMVEDPDAVGTEKKTLNIFDEEVDPTHLDETTEPLPEVILPPPAKVQQSPFKIRNLFPGTRVNVYAILQSSKTLPGNVILRGSTPDGAEIALRIAVTLSRLPHALGAPPALHALAARKIIQDSEDGQHAVPETLINPADTDLLARTVRTHIVRLGTTYQIMSTHTSFVAVDEAAHDGPLPPHPISITEPVQRDEARDEVVHSALLQTPPMVIRKPARHDESEVRPSGSRPVAPKLQISGGRPRYYVACPGSDSSDAEDTGAYYGGPINSCISNPSNPTRPHFSKPSLSLNLAYIPPPLPSASNLPPPLPTVPPPSDAHDILPPLSAVGPSSSQSAPAPTQNMTRAECLAYACAEANRRVDARVAAPSPPQSPDDLLSPALSDSLMPTRKTTSLTPEDSEDSAQVDAASVRVEARMDALDLSSSTPPPVPPHSQPQPALMPTPQSMTREGRLASLCSKSHSRMTTPSGPSPLENFDDLLARFLSSGTALASTSTTRTTSTFSPDSPDMPAAPPAADMLEALARLQDFDGAFPSPSAVFALVPLKAGSTLDNVRRALALPAGADVLVGSVLALAFLGAKLKMGVEDNEKELGVHEAERDAWTAMYEKAQDWVEAALRDRGIAQTVEELEAKVAGILAIA